MKTLLYDHMVISIKNCGVFSFIKELFLESDPENLLFIAKKLPFVYFLFCVRLVELDELD